MVVHRLHREQLIRRGIREVFAFFSEARNLESLTPAWLRFEVLTPEPIAMRTGTAIEYRLRLHGLPMRWSSRIDAWEPEHRFIDRQTRGPYSLWHHLHEFEAHPEGTVMRDEVTYSLPLGPVGRIAHATFVGRDLQRVFDFRRAAVAELVG